MQKEEIIQKLEATLLMLHSLEAREFNYKHYIARANREQTCGTVCCLAGWYPKYFPESQLTWAKDHWGNLKLNYLLNLDVEYALVAYHGLKLPLVRAVFYGAELDMIPGIPMREEPHNYNKAAILKRLEYILDLIRDGRLNQYLELDSIPEKL